MIASKEACLICQAETTPILDSKRNWTYHRCLECGFTFKDPISHMTIDEEYQEYLLHENSLESTTYVTFLQDFIDQYVTTLPIHQKVLDYGSGPQPVLVHLMREEGLLVDHYDLFFHKDETYKSKKYDVITSTEVVEHFKNPIQEFTHLVSLLEDKGYLVIMTLLNKGKEKDFLGWYYRREMSHVSFYTLQSMEIIANLCNLKLIQHNHKNIIVFQKT